MSRVIYRCSNPECRLYGFRILLAEGTDYTCQCGEPGTLSPTARKYLDEARAALRSQGAKR